MGKAIADLFVRIGADISGLVTGLGTAAAEVEAFGGKVANGMGGVTRAVDEGKASLATLGTAFEDAGAFGMGFAGMVAGETRNMAAEVVSAGSRIGGIGAGIRGAFGTIAGAASSMGGAVLEGVKALPEKLAAVGEAITQIGERAVPVTAMLGLAGGGLAFALLDVGKHAVELSSHFEQSDIAFQTLIGNAAQAKVFVKNLFDFAETTPFEFFGIEQDAQKLLAFGFNAQQTIPILKAVGDSMSALGKSGADMDNVVEALGQIQAMGHVTGREMMRLSMEGIPAYQLLAQQMGITVEQVQKEIAKGSIEANTAITALTSGLEGRFGGLMAKQMGTVQGIMSNLKDVTTLTLATLGDKIVATFDLKGKLSGISSFMSEMRTLLEEGAGPLQVLDAALERFGLHGSQVRGVNEALTQLGRALSAVADFLGKEIAEAWKQVEPFLGEHTKEVVYGIAGAIGGVLVFAFAGLLAIVGPTVLAMAPFLLIGAALAVLAELIYSNWSSITGFFVGLWEKVRDTTVGAWNAITAAVQNAWDWFLRLAVNTVNTILSFVEANWPLLLGVLTGPIGLAVGEILQHFTGLQTGIKGVIDNIKAWWDGLILGDKHATVSADHGGDAGGKGKGGAQHGSVPVLSGLGDAFSKIGAVAHALWDGIVAAIKNILGQWGHAFSVMGTIAHSVWDGLVKSVQSIAGQIGQAFSGLGSFLHGVWDGIVSVAQAAWGALATWWKTWGDTVIFMFGGVVGYLYLLLKQHWDQIKTAAQIAWDTITHVAEVCWNAISGAITDKIVQAIQELARDWELIKIGASAAWDALSGVASDKWQQIVDAMSGKLKEAESALSQAWAQVEKPLADAWDALSGKASDAFGKVKTAIETAMRGIHIPLPHVTVTATKTNVAPGVDVNLPDFNVQWYAKGGIFNQPSIIGVGEAGPEAVVPLDRLSQLGASRGGGDVHITQNVTISGHSEDVVRQLRNELRQSNAEIARNLRTAFGS